MDDDMFGILEYGSFVAAVLVFQAVPGAGTIAILDATAREGRAAGLAAVAGTLVGDLVYMIAALAGLAAVMQAHPGLFHVLQWLGAAYLCWIGIGLIRARIGGPAGGGPHPRLPVMRRFRRALAVSLTNPKVILFFVSFFPLFLRPDAPAATLLAMMLHVTLISLLWQAGLVVAGNAVARRLSALPSARRMATRIAGIAMLALGVRLAAGNA